MSSFQNFFNEEFLLSSTLKPKNSTSYTEVPTHAPKVAETKDVTVADEKNIFDDFPVKEPETKRTHIEPAPKTDSSNITNVGSNAQIQSPSFTNILTAPSSPQSLSDQILQVRIKLQIYQKEYAHFVECANRSSLQIQEALDELNKLVNLNFDAESLKSKANNLQYGDGLSERTSPQVSPNIIPVATKSDNTSVRVPDQDFSINIKSVKHRPRVFPRKPRCLLFNTNQPTFSDLMITSSLDGSLQLWSKSDQKIQTSMYLPSYLHKPFFVEDLCWDRKATGLLALGLCESSNALLNDEANGSNQNRSDRQIAFLQFNKRNPFESPKFISSPLTPHERNITVIESWSSSKNSSEASNFLTGGLDKVIFSWKVVNNGNSSSPEISVRELHRRHTSSVQAICYDWNSSDIWSGGADCRLVQWSSGENRIINELRWENRISHLIKTKSHPDLILATVMSMSSQLRLFDSRINSVVHSFGTQETANLSRYVRPSWHPDGNLIANGTISPADSVGSINIWDIRMMGSNPANGIIKQIKTINCEDRRLIRAEFAPDGRSLVGMSTDGSLTFVEF